MTTAEQVLSGDIRALSQLITRVENEDPDAIPVLRELYSNTGHAHIIGFTGAPGAGKSSVIGALIPLYLARGHKVAVLAVDPTSAFTGGGVLGDRVRMPIHHENLYIRSLGARGQLGGLSPACGSAIRVLDAAGYDRILVETVGAGQSEIEIHNFADTVVVLTSPHQGDDIQAMKAGLLEIGDIFAVNKAELPDAERTVADIVFMTHLLAGRQMKMHCPSCTEEEKREQLSLGNRIPPVVKLSVRAGSGVTELLDAIEGHCEGLVSENLLMPRRLSAVRHALESEMLSRWRSEVLSLAAPKIEALCHSIGRAETDPWSAAEELWGELKL